MSKRLGEGLPVVLGLGVPEGLTGLGLGLGLTGLGLTLGLAGLGLGVALTGLGSEGWWTWDTLDGEIWAGWAGGGGSVGMWGCGRRSSAKE